MRHERLLQERNLILKKDSIDKTQLNVVTKQLIDASETIVNYRSVYVNEINQILSKIITQLKGEKEKAYIEYIPFVPFDKNFKDVALRAYEKNLDSDIKRKATQIGIHREDIKMILNGKDMSSYGSQGENRVAVISLKLAPYFLIEDKSKRPIVVLDDVMSELDKTRQEKLLTFLRKLEQVFITSVNTNVKNASIYEVKEHTVTRRNA